jgi:hypothetical protein
MEKPFNTFLSAFLSGQGHARIIKIWLFRNHRFLSSTTLGATASDAFAPADQVSPTPE